MYFYAVQVMSGQEEDFLRFIALSRPDLAFHHIKKSMTIRKAGKHITQSIPLFPGYLFFQWGEPELTPAVISSIRRTRHYIRFLPASDRIAPLNALDSEIIRRLLSLGRELGSSLVTFDENNRIRVIEGPLMGLEGSIVKVNKRKRRAKVALDMNDSPIFFDLSFEVLEVARKAEA